MLLELLKFRGKNLEDQIWIYYTLIYFQKHINKFKKLLMDLFRKNQNNKSKEL